MEWRFTPTCTAKVARSPTPNIGMNAQGHFVVSHSTPNGQGPSGGFHSPRNAAGLAHLINACVERKAVTPDSTFEGGGLLAPRYRDNPVGRIAIAAGIL